MKPRELRRAGFLALLTSSVAACGNENSTKPEEPPLPPDGDMGCATCGVPGAPSCATEADSGACFSELATYDGATPLSISVAWSPIDDFVLSGADGALRLLELGFDPPAFRELAVFREQGGRTAVAWSPDGQYALSASTDVRLLAVDRASGSLAEVAPPFTGHSGDVYAIAWSPDGTLALSVGEDGTARLLAVDAARDSLEELAAYHVARGQIYDVAFSPGGDRAAVANEDGTLVILSVDVERRSLAEVARLTDDSWVTAVAWSPRGDALLRGTWLPCNTVELLSVRGNGAELEPASSFLGHTSGMRVLEFSPGGDIAATAGHDDTVLLFELAGPERPFEHFATWRENRLGVHAVSFSPDGTRLVVAASHADRLTLLDVSACAP